jgi:hypothetical protein
MLYLHNVGGLFCLPLPFSSMGLLIPMAMIASPSVGRLILTVTFPKNQQDINPGGSPWTSIINQQDIDTLSRYCYSVRCGKCIEKQFLAVKVDIIVFYAMMSSRAPIIFFWWLII